MNAEGGGEVVGWGGRSRGWNGSVCRVMLEKVQATDLPRSSPKPNLMNPKL